MIMFTINQAFKPLRSQLVFRTRQLQLAMSTSSADVEPVVSSIKAVGDKIRDMKANKASKEEIIDLVTELKTLKAKYEVITGESFDPPKKESSKKKNVEFNARSILVTEINLYQIYSRYSKS